MDRKLKHVGVVQGSRAWLSAREQTPWTIGASDAASAMGIPEAYEGQYALYNKKLGKNEFKKANVAMSWGTDHEEIAAQEYLKTQPEGTVMLTVGMFHSEELALVASVDRVCVNETRGTWLVEIKCPFSKRPADLINDDKFLIQTHQQMLLSGIHSCDLYVWTPELGVACKTIPFDGELWSTRIYPRIKEFQDAVRDHDDTKFKRGARRVRL